MQEGALGHVFGPVMSGRLGRSLGLDLLGERVCSMNCAYCESGPLKRLTVERAPYVPAEVLLAELRAWDEDRRGRGEPLPDAVTLGGLGEPTLNADMPRIMAGARAILPGVPVAVLTNASLMDDPEVRAELALADVVLPSLDSLVPEEFAQVNRGHPKLDCAAIAQGILAFRRQSAARVCLEVLLVAGVNDSDRNLELMKEYCALLAPHRVDVTTLSRPGTEKWAKPADPATLARWRSALGPLAAAGGGVSPGVGAGLAHAAEKGQEQCGAMSPAEARARIQASLARRPQTAAQLSRALLADPDLVADALAKLVAGGQAEEARREGAEIYYQARG